MKILPVINYTNQNSLYSKGQSKNGNNLNFIEMCQYFLKISLKNTCILLAKISPYVYLEFLPLAAEAGSRFNFCFIFFIFVNTIIRR